MRKEITIKIKPRFVNKFKNGYPLILKEALVDTADLTEEGDLIRLVDTEGKFIVRGYYGRQNKGYGWILSRQEKEKIDQNFFAQKIGTALKYRGELYHDPETNAFRVFNGAGDGIGGLTIDYFGGYYLLTWYSKGIYAYKDKIITALSNKAEVKGIYQKKRFDMKGKYIEDDDFVSGERGQFPLLVKENGVDFAVYLNDGAMVGIFLDQRQVRRTIRDKYAEGKTVLNTFSYTGAFSVYAVLGGALKTTSVDLANRSLPKTSEQFQINGIDPKNQNILVQDVFAYFKYAARKGLKFDLLILDPPSFASSKKMKFSAANNYKDLLKEAIAIISDDGIIVASTNCSTFGMKKFKSFIETAFKELGIGYRILEEFGLPPDFKVNKMYEADNYLKVVFVKRESNNRQQEV